MKKAGEGMQTSGGVSMDAYEYRMDVLEVKMEQIERKIANKADEIVSLQVLQHRQELEDIYQTMRRIDHQIKAIDRELRTFSIGHRPLEMQADQKRSKDSLRLGKGLFGT
ncbi:hypothetical protein EV207_10290 [Scopulibacillus darangshiensis]|uniref:Uncharacterized protein n=1 Tax=Scopulibacillus darangshiensis TaxID=442528 RepID=A0A4R2P988_9BACL|nr:hypothetical protein [Scopulibacillus darangshiensis]TCP31600.1 hypothetical protein EV207_10290 [Scopulibacillus darangshiensis]